MGYELPTSALDLRVPLLDFHIFVDDLSAESDDRLRARLMTDVGKLALLTLRHARDEDLMDHLERWADLWAAVARAPSGLMALNAIVSYIGQVSPSASKERLLRLIPTATATSFIWVSKNPRSTNMASAATRIFCLVSSVWYTIRCDMRYVTRVISMAAN